MLSPHLPFTVYPRKYIRFSLEKYAEYTLLFVISAVLRFEIVNLLALAKYLRSIRIVSIYVFLLSHKNIFCNCCYCHLLMSMHICWVFFISLHLLASDACVGLVFPAFHSFICMVVVNTNKLINIAHIYLL